MQRRINKILFIVREADNYHFERDFEGTKLREIANHTKRIVNKALEPTKQKKRKIASFD